MVKLKLDFSHFLKRLEISSKNPYYTSLLTGNYLSSFKGSGIEFEDFRPYGPADDASKIDWLASSKSNELLVRNFVEERNVNFFVLLDTSSSMFFTSTDKLKCEYAAEMAAALIFSIIEASDNVGFAMFGKGIIKYLAPSSGKKHYFEILAMLQDEKNYGEPKKYDKSFQELLTYIKEKSILFIISDFIWIDNQ